MKEKIIESIRRGWKVQTFQYDYIFHIKGIFVVVHLGAFIFIWFLIGYIHHYLGLLFVPCAVSWNYFIFFDRGRKVYKDSYVPLREERIGTMFTTIVFCVVFVFSFAADCFNLIR